jgi:hypothetical protein
MTNPLDEDTTDSTEDKHHHRYKYYDDGLPFASNCVDTVITNPPFGTKHNAGMDLQFLRTAIRLARRAVYSFHKTSTRSFVMKTCQAWGLQVQVIAAMKFDIPQVYEFHKHKSVDVEVDLLRVALVVLPSPAPQPQPQPPQADIDTREPKNNDTNNNHPSEGVGSSDEDDEGS